MYTDPQSVTVNAVAQSLPRIGASNDTGKFASATKDYVLTVSHSAGRRNQHRVRLDSSKIITDPLASDRNFLVSASAYLVIDVPPTGYSVAEMGYIVTAVADWLKAGTNTARLVGSEI